MAASAPATDRLRVLIVEDSRDARTTMRMMLSLAYGFVVFEAATGESGIATALLERPDVVLIDLGLPDIGGHEVARRIRAALDERDTLLVALTGYGTPEDYASTREAGFDLHLVKPVASAELAQLFARRKEMRAQPDV
jgi:CheY-like chemotaxis protein